MSRSITRPPQTAPVKALSHLPGVYARRRFINRPFSFACIFFAALLVSAPRSNCQQITQPPASNPLNYTTNWIGNSLPGNNPGSNVRAHVPLDMLQTYVAADGTVYTNSGWDEGGRAVSVFKNGQLLSPDASNAGGEAIAVSGSTIFSSADTGLGSNPACTQGGCGVNVLNASTLASEGSLSGDSSLSATGHIYGLAVSNGKLYAALDDDNKVDVFSASSLALTNSFSINDPVLIAVDSNGGMWVSHKDHTALPNVNGVVYDIFGQFGLSTIDHYDNNGNHINTITLPDNGKVSALWIDGNNNLYVGDQGQDQNIKIYTNILSSPTLSSTFGTKGGIYANNAGVVGPGLFRFITGVGTDSAGNIYVSDNDFGHGVLLSSYSPSGQLNWQVQGLEFVSLGGVDPNSESDFYDAYHHFTVNYGNQSGNLGTYYSDTYNPFAYPDDLRTTSDASGGQIQYIQGHKFLLVTNQSGVALEILRFQAGSEIAIPCVAFDYGAYQQGTYRDFVNEPADGEFIWRDLNGNGQIDTNEFSEPSNNSHRDGQDFWLDSNGDMWQVNYLSSTESSIHIRRYQFQGFDQYGAPIYDYNHVETYNQSTDFPELTDADRVIFRPGDSAGGTLYIAGANTGTGSFTKVARIDNWDQGNRSAKWVANIPWNSNQSSQVIPNSISEVGNYFFIDYNTPHYVLVYSTADGSYVGELDAGSNVGGPSNIGNDDEWASTSAYLRSNGQYVITKEEDYQAKLLLYVWTPPGVTPQTATPTFSPAGGTYSSAQSVTISDSTGGATIYYTTNGSTPTTSSTVYSGPVTVASSETLKAIAQASGSSTSAVATASYTISGPSEAAYNGPHNLPGTVEASDYDTGGQGVAYNQTNNGGQTGYRSDNNSAIEGSSSDNNSPANGYDLGWTASGQWTKYTVVAATAGTYTVTFSVSSHYGQTDAFHLQNAAGTNISGNINAPSTGGDFNWQTVTATVTLPAGTQTLELAEDNGGWNLEYLTFTSNEAAYNGPHNIPGTVEASDYDTGGQGVAYNQTNNGGQTGYRSDNNSAIEGSSSDNNSPANGYDLGWTASGQWTKYTVVVATAGTYKVTFSVASPSGQTDAFHLQNAAGTNLSGNINVPNTGGYFTWQTVTATVTLPAGTQTLELAEDNGGWNLEYITFASNEAAYNGPHNIPGTVEASDYDTGGQGVAYNQTNNGGQTGYRSDNNSAIEGNSSDNNSPANGYDLGWTASGQWAKYTVVAATAGTYKVTFSVASPSGQTDAFHLQNAAGTNLSGNINVPNTGGYFTWQTVTANVTLPAGTQTLELAEDNGGWNLEYITFAASSSPAVEINAGGSGLSGTNWVADTDYNQGGTETFTNSVNIANVTNPAPAAVYQTDRGAYGTGGFTYTVPGLTANKSYTVRLHFCENYWTAVGDRVFNVSINGTQVLSNFDVFKAAGGQSIANIQQFTATANSSGQIVIAFTTVTDNAIVNGIEIDN